VTGVEWGCSTGWWRWVWCRHGLRRPRCWRSWWFCPRSMSWLIHRPRTPSGLARVGARCESAARVLLKQPRVTWLVKSSWRRWRPPRRFRHMSDQNRSEVSSLQQEMSVAGSQRGRDEFVLVQPGGPVRAMSSCVPLMGGCFTASGLGRWRPGHRRGVASVRRRLRRCP